MKYTHNPSEKFIEEMERAQFNSEVNDDAALFLSTGDARFFWRAFVRLHRAGQPIPQNFLDKLAQWGDRLLQAESANEIAGALQLAGTGRRHIGPAQSDAYATRWRLAREVQEVRRLFGGSLSAAIDTVATNRGLSAGRVKKAYHSTVTAPAAGVRERKAIASAVRLSKLW